HELGRTTVRSRAGGGHESVRVHLSAVLHREQRAAGRRRAFHLRDRGEKPYRIVERLSPQNMTGGGEKRGRWPAAERVSLGDIGTLVDIDENGNRALLDRRRELTTGERVRQRLGARVTPSRDQHEQYRFLLTRGTVERRCAPVEPLDHARNAGHYNGRMP